MKKNVMDMTRGPIMPQLVRFATPVLLGMLFPLFAIAIYAGFFREVKKAKKQNDTENFNDKEVRS